MYFDVILADPPWGFNDKLTMKDGVLRSADSQYSTMPIQAIKALDVKSLAAPAGCVLALWVPGSMLQWGLDTMTAWGFKHKQTYVWVKTKKDALADVVAKGHMDECTVFGMGRLFRQSHELALIGTRGKPSKTLVNKSQRSVSFDQNMGHSVKPGKLQASLELMFPGARRLEMFARRNRDRWLCVGNELTSGQDIADTIVDLQQL